MIYVPKRSKIPSKVCVVDSGHIYGTNTFNGQKIISIKFSKESINLPNKTIAIVMNEFSGPFTMGIIKKCTSNFYSNLIIENAIKSDLNPALKIELRYWAINEIIMNGLVEKDGKLSNGIKLVAVIYGQYSTMVLKDGEIYNKIINM